LEQAVSGVQAITMANANYTLTNLNGVSDEARNMVLVVSGTNSGIYQIIAPLNQPKFYIVSNQTVGGYAITIGASSGSVISIPNGVTAQVYTDGTNFYSAQTGAGGNFNIAGNLTVTGTSTLTGAVTASSTLGVTGLITGSAGISTTTGTFSGAVSGTTGTFSAGVSGTTGTFSGAVSGTTITASTQFSGPGTGLTGTAASLSIGGNATTATTATSATTATNLASGSANVIPYQTASGTTSFLPAGTSGYVLTSNGSGSAPSWATGIAAASLVTTNFTVQESGGKLVFKYGATTIASLDSSGNFTTLASHIAGGTP
jgi:hypothetical protein